MCHLIHLLVVLVVGLQLVVWTGPQAMQAVGTRFHAGLVAGTWLQILLLVGTWLQVLLIAVTRLPAVLVESVLGLVLRVVETWFQSVRGGKMRHQAVLAAGTCIRAAATWLRALLSAGV